jgi:hypothetical protein
MPRKHAPSIGQAVCQAELHGIACVYCTVLSALPGEDRIAPYLSMAYVARFVCLSECESEGVDWLLSNGWIGAQSRIYMLTSWTLPKLCGLI